MTHVQTETFNDGTTGTGDGIIAGIEFNKDGTKMFTSFGFDLKDPADDLTNLGNNKEANINLNKVF